VDHDPGCDEGAAEADAKLFALFERLRVDAERENRLIAGELRFQAVVVEGLGGDAGWIWDVIEVLERASER